MDGRVCTTCACFTDLFFCIAVIKCTSSSATAAATTTMKPSPAAINAFMQTNQDVYPCSDVPCTRSSYYPKWLLASRRYKQGQIWRQNGHHVIKFSWLSHDNAQNLIISGDALSLPAVFGEVVDSLEKWGATHWSCWLQKSLRLIHEYLKEDNVSGGVAPCKMRVFHDCIILCVERKAEHNFIRNSANYNLVLSTWKTYFWVRCWEVSTFFDLAHDSMQFVANQVESMDRIHSPTRLAMMLWTSSLNPLFR